MAPWRHDDLRRPDRRGFTLIELIFVLVLLSIAAAMVAPRMTGFFRGRALNFEARRMLSLMHYGQSRAVAEGVPVILWLDPKGARYGLRVQTGYVDVDDHEVEYTLEPTLTLELPTGDTPPPSENDDEKLGIEDGLSVVRFNPTGFFDDSSVQKIVIRQGDEAALQLVPTQNRLGYEILPLNAVN